MRRGFPWLLTGALLLLPTGCSKSRPVAEGQDRPATVDHIVASKPQPPNNFLHKTFTVRTDAEFAFTVPAHIVKPVLQGSFVSFAKNKSGDLLSNRSADVDVLLLNDQEFNDFSQSKQGTATYTLEPSYGQSVAYRILGTIGDPQTYHLIFRNSPGGAPSKLVKADFTVSFE
jgi:hypothetical protein